MPCNENGSRLLCRVLHTVSLGVQFVLAQHNLRSQLWRPFSSNTSSVCVARMMISVHLHVARAPILAWPSSVQLVIQREAVTESCSAERPVQTSIPTQEHPSDRLFLRPSRHYDAALRLLCGDLSRLLQSSRRKRLRQRTFRFFNN